MKNLVNTADARVNKFPGNLKYKFFFNFLGMTELARKIALTQAIRSMKELYPLEYRFYPNSWVNYNFKTNNCIFKDFTCSIR